jgi:hypothetical protein
MLSPVGDLKRIEIADESICASAFKLLLVKLVWDERANGAAEAGLHSIAAAAIVLARWAALLEEVVCNEVEDLLSGW